MTEASVPLAAEHPLPVPLYRHVARVVLGTFLLTFVASRGVVVLIMAGKLPDLFFHVGKTHVHIHHLNYGIAILSVTAAYLLFRRPASGRPLTAAAVSYGIGMGLTFDEFGMWVHLGGSYWQAASYDAVVAIAAAFALLAYAPSWNRYRREHVVWTVVLTGTVVVFVAVLAVSISPWAHRLGPWLRAIEAAGPQ